MKSQYEYLYIYKNQIIRAYRVKLSLSIKQNLKISRLD
jgi:hypothetical protein